LKALTGSGWPSLCSAKAKRPLIAVTRAHLPPSPLKMICPVVDFS